MTAHKEIEPAGERPLLDVLREQIDGIDEEIMALVARRTALTLAIGEEKQQRGIPTMVSDRHSRVIANYIAARPDESPMTVQHAVQLGEVVMGISREAQDTQRRQSEADQAAERADLARLAEESLQQ